MNAPVLAVVEPIDGGLANAEVRSLPVMERGTIAPELPFGDARNIFCGSDVAVTARVPAPVTGEPVTVRKVGVVRATDVTVPLPPPAVQPITPALLKSTWPLVHVPVIGDEPEARLPGMPAMSPATRERGVMAPAAPSGEARTSFWGSLVAVTAKVPDVVIGDPATVRNDGRVSATDVTVPLPAAEHPTTPAALVRTSPLGQVPVMTEVPTIIVCEPLGIHAPEPGLYVPSAT